MFKKLVYQISKIKTEDDRNQCFGAIDYMFNKTKSTGKIMKPCTRWPLWSL